MQSTTRARAEIIRHHYFFKLALDAFLAPSFALCGWFSAAVPQRKCSTWQHRGVLHVCIHTRVPSGGGPFITQHKNRCPHIRTSFPFPSRPIRTSRYPCFLRRTCFRLTFEERNMTLRCFCTFLRSKTIHLPCVWGSRIARLSSSVSLFPPLHRSVMIAARFATNVLQALAFLSWLLGTVRSIGKCGGCPASCTRSICVGNSSLLSAVLNR